MKKRLSFCVFVSLLIFSSCTGIANKEVFDMGNVAYSSGIYHDKNWDESVGTYTGAVVPDKETAIKIASAVLPPIQAQGYVPDYVVQAVFFDETDEIWIVSFWEDREHDVDGGDCSIAIKKADAQVLRIWFGE